MIYSGISGPDVRKLMHDVAETVLRDKNGERMFPHSQHWHVLGLVAKYLRKRASMGIGIEIPDSELLRFRDIARDKRDEVVRELKSKQTN